jgi:hypothetical protein
MKRIAIYAAVMLASSAGTAFAQSKDVAYFCVGEAAGGLWYNQQTNKWESHSFIPSQKFVLKIKFPGARVRKGASEKQASDYNITITKTGENTGLPCRGYDANATVTVSDLYGIFISCIMSGNEYQFNLGTNRFLSITATATQMVRITMTTPLMSKLVHVLR